MGERAEYDKPGHEPSARSETSRAILRTEFSDMFVDAMRNRMMVSFYKYGPVGVNCPEKIDALNSMALHLDRCRDSGNAEALVDAANYLMIEFMHPSHRSAHFRGTDSDESPGRVEAETGRRLIPVKADSSLDKLRAKYGR